MTDEARPYINPEISLGHIMTIVAMVFTFGSFYAMTNYQITQFQKLLEKHSGDIETLKIKQAVSEAQKGLPPNGITR